MRAPTLAIGVFALLFVVFAFHDGSSPPDAQAGGEATEFLWADIDCDGDVDIIDSLALERFVAGLGVPPPEIQEPCFDLGAKVGPLAGASVAGQGVFLTWGNVTCIGDVDVLDSLAVKRFVAGLAVPPPAIGEDCLDINEPFTLSGELPPLTVEVLETGDVPPDIPGMDGVGPARPLAVLEDEDGNQTVFVENELVIVTDDMNVLNDFLSRWNATLVKTLTPSDYDIDVPRIHIVSIDPSDIDTSQMQEDLRQVNEFAWGDFAVSSQDAAELLAVAASEAADGLPVDLNWVMQGSNYDQRELEEAPTGPPGWNSNPFTWTYMNQDSPQDIGVGDAWRALSAADKFGNKVKLSILDGGFSPNDDFPAGYTVYGGTGIENPANCTAGSDCPWHGTMVTGAAMGVPDNGYGVAGPAGPIADAILTQSPSSDIGSYIQYIFIHLPTTAVEGPDIINISAGSGIASEWCLTGICSVMDGLVLGMRELGILMFASAGNDNKNVDEEKCIDLPFLDPICYERTVWVPCEVFDVICVGGLADNSNEKQTGTTTGSNYGGSDSATVDIFGPYVQWQTPDPEDGLRFGNCGTSCASPFVAGVAALIMAADPTLNADEVAAVLMDTAHTDSDDKRVPRWVDAYEAVILALGNAPPELTIGSHDTTWFGGIPTDLGVLLKDAEDLPSYGDPYNGLPSLQWTSSIDGAIGTDIILTDLLLSYGLHAITVTATDSAGSQITDQTTIDVINDPPTVQIVNPADGRNFFEGQQVRLRASSSDRNYVSEQLDDGDLTWYLTPPGSPDDRSNPLGNGHQLAVNLLEGDYNIVLVGTDDFGASATDIAINIHVDPPPADFPPDVVIDNVNDSNACVNPLFYFVFTGHANDVEDGPLTGTSLVWTLNGSTVLGTGASLQVPTAQIPPGDHTLTLTATDSNNGTGEDTVLLHFDGCFGRFR